MANPVLVAAGAVKAVQAANALAEGEHQDGIYRLANSGVPSINGQMVRRIEHVGEERVQCWIRVARVAHLVREDGRQGDRHLR